MKLKFLVVMPAAFITLGIISDAKCVPFGAYANSLTVRNIATMQHSIATNAIQTFEGTMAAALGNRARFDIPATKEPDTEHRRISQYGRMPTYGEYNDDGTATQHGRNGGDNDSDIPTFNSLWANWQHFDDDVKYNGLEKIDIEYDVVTLGLAGSHAQLGHGISQWGLYGGYAGGTQKNQLTDIKENGGYMGVYSGYSIDNFNLSASVNAGAMFSDSELHHGTFDYSNAWIGTMVHGSYNIAIDDTLTLQPSFYAGYTWVKSDDFILGALDVTNSNLNTFELTPEIRLIKHIGDGWFGTAHARYVFAWESGGDTTIDNMYMRDFDTDNFVEYGIGVEKSIDRFNISLHIGRRDGGHNGWNGGTSFKYIF